MPEEVECPECGKVYGSKRAFYSHWGNSGLSGHGGKTPDEIGPPEFSQEHRKKISESKMGHSPSEETRKSISETLTGSEGWSKGLTKETDDRLKNLADSVTGFKHTDETKEKISEIKKQQWKDGVFDDAEVGSKPGHNYGHKGRKKITVEETGHIVDSGWEAEIDRLFHMLGLDYDHDPEPFEFENGRTHKPDFVVKDRIAVEVKGWPISDWHKERAQLFMNEYPEYTYMVIGTTEIPADMAIRWDDRQFVEEVL